MAPVLEASFVHVPGQRDRIHVRRSDGSEISWAFPNYGPGLPHDLVHLVVESALGLSRGFWGRVDAGVDPARVAEEANRRGGLDKYCGFGEDRRELLLAEALAGGPWSDPASADEAVLEAVQRNATIMAVASLTTSRSRGSRRPAPRSSASQRDGAPSRPRGRCCSTSGPTIPRAASPGSTRKRLLRRRRIRVAPPDQCVLQPPRGTDGRMVGMGLGPSGAPKPGTSDPPPRLRHRVTVPPKIIDLSAWVEEQNRSGRHSCHCGCGKPIRVLPQHHSKGIPLYLRAHHPMAMTCETHRLHEAGLLTSGLVTRELGISLTTLRRLEGKLFDPPRREGKRGLRVFTPEQVEVIRETLRSTTRLGSESALLSLDKVAQRAGCHRQTIERRMGKELPLGLRMRHPRHAWGFTSEEATQIAVWVKRHVRGRRRRG